MVEVAQEAFRSKNFSLASEIYERVIQEKGPASSLLLALGNCLALDGQIIRAFTAFIKAYRLGNIESTEIKHLIQSLVKLTRSRMQRLDVSSGLLLKTKDVLEREPFVCTICLSTILEPTTIYCGHTFCRRCLAKQGSNTCINCGENPKVKAQFKVNVVLTEVMDKLFPHLNDIINLKSSGNGMFMEEKYEEAVDCYSQILRTRQGDHTIWSNRSYAHWKLGNYEQALEDAGRAIHLRPQWGKGYYRQAAAEESLGRTEEAALSYMKCLAIDGGCKQARGSLTQIIHTLLQPKMSEVDLKHTPCSSTEPMSNLMAAGDSDHTIERGLSKITSLLDKQLQGHDHEMQFDSAINKMDLSLLTADMFDCSLCFRLLHKPVTTPCGHVFCQHCLDRSLDHSVACPQCRGDISEYLSNRNRAITVSIQYLLNLRFPKEVEERATLHQQDLAAFSLLEATAVIPIFVCAISMPTISCPLHIFEPRYRLMMRQVMETGVRQFGMCLSLPDEAGSYAEVGTMLEIKDLKFFEDGRSVVDTVGGRRFRVLSKSMRDGYHIAKVAFLEDEKEGETTLPELVTLHDGVYLMVKQWLSALPEFRLNRIQHQYGNLPPTDHDIQGARLGPKWMWWITAILPVDPRAQLAMLKMTSLRERLTTISKVITYLNNRQQ